MKKLLEKVGIWLLNQALKVRYRVTVKGLDKLSPDLFKEGRGTLFLPNHPAIFVDPVIVTLPLWKRFRPRPMIVEYMYYLPGVNAVMRHLGALPVPNFDTSTNSLKRSRNDKIFNMAIEGLKQGDNFLVYPAGRLKSTGAEVVGGASGVHRILQEVPDVNVVLVRTTGLWGSSFSRAWTGKSPPFFPMLLRGIKIALKNFLFFCPKREVTVEYILAPADLPRHAPRLELNRWLDQWYNQPFGDEGEPFKLVPEQFWSSSLPNVKEFQLKYEEVDLSHAPPEVKTRVTQFLAKLTEREAEDIKPDMVLATDLGLDSLDAAEIMLFLEDNYNVSGFLPSDINTVGQLIGVAAGIIGQGQEPQEENTDLKHWHDKKPRLDPKFFSGDTIVECFLNRVEALPNEVACADARSGVLTYRQMKQRMALLASYIQTIPGDKIGIMLPAGVGASLLILAAQLAGKTPVMINWTLGPRHLDAVVKATDLKKVITAWAFVDRLKNVDLTGVEDYLVMLEEVARDHFGLRAKLKAFFSGMLSTKRLLAKFGGDRLKPESVAGILFTSGTEARPKGVPLTHQNILSNQRAVLQSIQLRADDILYATLPPFHSFGFAITGLLPLLCGVKVAFYPDPTNSKGLAKGIEKWGITLFCSAPTFLKGVLRVATPEQLRSIRLFVSGAEKAPRELRDMIAKLGEDKQFLEGYGITECAPALTFNRLGEVKKGVGKPIGNVDLLIVHPDTHEILRHGEPGLILCRGPNVFNGYLNPHLPNPFLMVDGDKWYNTGDLGYLDEEGNLNLVGRKKRFVKIAGEMVSLSSIEDALQEIAPERGWDTNEEGPSLAVCATETTGDRPKIVLFTRFPTSVEEVNTSLREAGFSNLVRVNVLKQLPEIPILGTGKINYRELEQDYCGA